MEKEKKWEENPDLSESAKSFESRRSDDRLDETTRMTPLLNAAAEGRSKDMDAILRAGADISARDKAGRSAMHWGVLNDNIDICWLLVRYGLDANVRDNLGQTPLHLAAKYGQISVAKYLVSHGARLDLRDNDGRFPADWSLLRGDADAVRLFESMPQDQQGEGVNAAVTDAF